jgi:hypothetical protein
MTTALRFREHQGFHRSALYMIAAGGGAGLLAWALFRPVWTAGSVALVAAAAAVAALIPARTRAIGRGARLAGLAPVFVAAGLAVLGAVLLAFLPPAQGVFGFAALFGASLSVGLRGRRLALAIGAAAAVAGVALWVQTQVLVAEELASLPAWSLAGLAGLAFSMVSVVALVPRHLEVRRDPIGEAYRDLSQRTSGEVKELLARAYELWSKAGAELPEEDDSRRLLAEAVTRLFDTARRWIAIDADGSQAQTASLTDRIAQLDERISNARDEVVRTQYEQAQAALAEQLRYLEDIATHRERVLARMHNYLAVMERLRLALVKLESADASREALDPIVSDLQELGHDIETSAAALAAAERAAGNP